MSRITLSGNASGTGTFTIASPNSNTDQTIALPDITGTLVSTDASGNVGIGTTSPDVRLHVQTGSGEGDPAALVVEVFRIQRNSGSSAGAGMTLVAGSAAEAGIYFGDNATAAAGAVVYSNASDVLLFRTNGTTERMRLDASGLLYIKRTSLIAGYASAINLSHDGGALFGIMLQNTSTTVSNALSFINSSSAPVGAIATSTTATAYNTSSDYRLKENVQPMQNALAKVAQLNPVTYTWKADGSDGQGFIAHELQAVVPDCVTGEKDAVDEDGNPQYQGVDTSFLVATLVKAIQEQQATIASLEARIAALEAV